MKQARFIFVVSVLLLFSGFTQERLTGRVVKVQDGDTITILTSEKEQIKIRLYGIDAPEKSQDYGIWRGDTNTQKNAAISGCRKKPKRRD
ncbi:MAG: hypothetical protein LBT78_00095 [Tannerella sp.]|jgi:endonuclease YncB( thermonuclease family)|nr:hypothetical protein [Tannerella sp.]